jgi:hypothetical protein
VRIFTWDEPGGYPFTGQVVLGVNGGVNLICGFCVERGKAGADNTAPGRAVRGSISSSMKL